MSRARYIITLSTSEPGPASLSNFLRDFPDVAVLRMEGTHAVVMMEGSTAERLTSYPFLDVEADIQHRHVARSS